MQIDGQIEGEIVAGDDLVIGQGAVVTAEIQSSLGHRGGNGQWQDHRHPTDRDSPVGQDIGNLMRPE